MFGLLVSMILLHLATPLVGALFTYLALERLALPKRAGRWFAVAVFLVLLLGTAYAAGYFVHQTIRALPEIADKAIPAFITTAQRHGIELPFSDYDSLRDLAIDTVKGEVRYLGSFAKFARGATTQMVLLLAGCVVGMSLFLHPHFESGTQTKHSDVYSRCWGELSQRFRVLYRGFVTVMGAQIVISAINTLLTAIFVLILHLPYAVVVIGVTFLCGLVPVVGNLVSNTIVVAIAFTISPRTALLALVFLLVIHKLEYFLNSKVVGWRIRNPLWLTLLGLVVGERLLGIPGLILAPVILYYVKLEAAAIKVAHAPPRAP
jgi:predicted PurR-regulated permease PerM